MRQLKGKVKETSREKRQRKKDFEDIQRKVFTVVLPTIGALAIFVAAYVYVKTRPQNYISGGVVEHMFDPGAHILRVKTITPAKFIYGSLDIWDYNVNNSAQSDNAVLPN